MIELLTETMTIVREIADTIIRSKSKRRRRILAVEVQICHHTLAEIVKRGKFMLFELEALASDALDETSPALLVIVPRLQYRLRAQSFAVQRLSATLARIRRLMRIFAPTTANRVGTIVLTKESALVELAVAIDRGELPTIMRLRAPAEPSSEMLHIDSVVSIENLAERSHHDRLREYLGSGSARRHLAELEDAVKELREFLIGNFSVDELLDATDWSPLNDPDGIPGRF